MADSNRPMEMGAGPVVAGPRLFAARLVWGIHVGVVAFLLAGWALPWTGAWWIYVIGAPLIQIGWVVFDDHCWLSIIEAKLRRESLVRETVEGTTQRSFVAELIESLVGRPAPSWVASSISYLVLWGGFVIACARIRHG